MEPEIRITEVPIPEQEKLPSGSCIGCGSTTVRMSIFMIATTRNVSPRLTENTKVMAVCSNCCDPESPNYHSLGSVLAVQVFSLRNVIFSRMAEAQRAKVGN